MTGNLLEMRSVSRIYRRGGLFGGEKFSAVDNVTFVLPEEPCISSIVGESGSGKTTLARMILRLVEPSSGSITVLGKTVAGNGGNRLDSVEFRRLIQPIFQNPFEAFSAYLPVVEYLRRTAVNLLGTRTASETDAAVDRALQLVGLSLSRIDGKFIRQFSGGELQRISVARALIPNPRLIVADEPVSMVDASLRMSIINIFRRARDERGVTFIYITHDLSTAYYLSDHVSIMTGGRIIESGVPADVLDHPKHEYTRQLLDAVPRVTERWVEVAEINERWSRCSNG